MSPDPVREVLTDPDRTMFVHVFPAGIGGTSVAWKSGLLAEITLVAEGLAPVFLFCGFDPVTENQGGNQEEAGDGDGADDDADNSGGEVRREADDEDDHRNQHRQITDSLRQSAPLSDLFTAPQYRVIWNRHGDSLADQRCAVEVIPIAKSLFPPVLSTR